MSDLSHDWLNSPKANSSDDLIKNDKTFGGRKQIFSKNNFLSPKKKQSQNSIFQSSEKPLFPDSSRMKLKKNNFENENKISEEIKNKKIISDPFQTEKNSDKIKLNPTTNVIIIKDNENVREKSFQKQISKIKFFWRGTNFNYPYTFLKFIPEENEEDDEKSEIIDINDSQFFCFEDYSKKKINPSEKFYN